MPKRWTTEEFINKAREVHGDKYDYSKVDYINCDIKVVIICSEHGEFLQRPHEHIKGQGCPKCGNVFSAISRRSSTEDFIQKARKEPHSGSFPYE